MLYYQLYDGLNFNIVILMTWEEINSILLYFIFHE